ncbi:hypothetical protein RZS08_08165 [Arthrospira platensis SPKY1]|nr:hypothetical protein [Arthrospira platensis SPKY1]
MGADLLAMGFFPGVGVVGKALFDGDRSASYIGSSGDMSGQVGIVMCVGIRLAAVGGRGNGLGFNSSKIIINEMK